MREMTREEAVQPKDAGKARAEAVKKANTLRRRAKRAWDEEWDIKTEGFWNKQAERVAKAYGLSLRTFTLAGIPFATQYR